jgi:class 3 adenylate cyclase
VAEARQAMVALNEKNSETGRAPLNYGIGVHVGDVMYGKYRVANPALPVASAFQPVATACLCPPSKLPFKEGYSEVGRRRRCS